MPGCIKPPAPSSREGIALPELRASLSPSLEGFQEKNLQIRLGFEGEIALKGTLGSSCHLIVHP